MLIPPRPAMHSVGHESAGVIPFAAVIHQDIRPRFSSMPFFTRSTVSRRMSGNSSTIFVHGCSFLGRFIGHLYQSVVPNLSSHTRQGDDLHDIGLGVRAAGAVDRPLSDFRKDDLNAENS